MHYTYPYDFCNCSRAPCIGKPGSKPGSSRVLLVDAAHTQASDGDERRSIWSLDKHPLPSFLYLCTSKAFLTTSNVAGKDVGYIFYETLNFGR